MIVAPYPGATPTKPGSATLAQLGIDLALSDPITGEIKEGEYQVSRPLKAS